MNFWEKLKKPIMVLAPMADVTDPPFREIIAGIAKPDVFYTEFISADGLMHEKGRAHLLKDARFTAGEHPIVLQIFSSNPQKIKGAAALGKELGFDGIDINMGCPDKTIEKQGAGAALIKNPQLAKEIILAAKEGAGDLPVSVKTRLGYNTDELETYLPELLSAEPATIFIHARTRKEMSKVPARWERVARAVEIRNELHSKTLILGNGDAESVEHAKHLAEISGADGVMLGRAIFGNPWLFSTISKSELSPQEILETLIKHTELYESYFAGAKSFAVMKKHFKSYISGLPNHKELQCKLMEAKTAQEVGIIIGEYLINFV
jgi:nifR3 family TIM-barrel protein